MDPERTGMSHVQPHMRRMRADMSQVRPQMPHVRADLPHVQPDMEQMRAADSFVRRRTGYARGLLMNLRLAIC
jgi:hypothetical protein